MDSPLLRPRKTGSSYLGKTKTYTDTETVNVSAYLPCLVSVKDIALVSVELNGGQDWSQYPQ